MIHALLRVIFAPQLTRFEEGLRICEDRITRLEQERAERELATVDLMDKLNRQIKRLRMREVQTSPGREPEPTPAPRRRTFIPFIERMRDQGQWPTTGEPRSTEAITTGEITTGETRVSSDR